MLSHYDYDPTHNATAILCALGIDIDADGKFVRGLKGWLQAVKCYSLYQTYLVELLMSLKPAALDHIPDQTARLARAAFPNGNIYRKVRDELGALYQDEAFLELFPTRGRPVESPGRVALVTVFQFAEGLSDRAAADAVRKPHRLQVCLRAGAGRLRLRRLSAD